MSDMELDRVEINRIIAQLDSLYTSLTAQDFGRLMQSFLASVFEAAGFRVVENAVGVPDFTASVVDQVTTVTGTIAVEVKTSDSREITLSERDLAAIKTAGQVSVLAALAFPDRTPKWALVSADDLAPGRWPIRRLLGKRQVDVGFDLHHLFYRLLAGVDASTVAGGPVLDEWAAARRREFLSKVA